MTCVHAHSARRSVLSAFLHLPTPSPSLSLAAAAASVGASAAAPLPLALAPSLAALASARSQSGCLGVPGRCLRRGPHTAQHSTAPFAARCTCTCTCDTQSQPTKVAVTATVYSTVYKSSGSDISSPHSALHLPPRPLSLAAPCTLHLVLYLHWAPLDALYLPAET
jgi:hypothetical protein